MKIVAGLSLVNLKPQVWDATLPYYLPELDAVMISYADFHQSPTRRHRAIEEGLHTSLDIPKHVQIYLDNGAFRFSRAGGEVPRQDYEAFVEQTQPDWYAIPQDYIPTPCMSDYKQNKMFRKDNGSQSRILLRWLCADPACKSPFEQIHSSV